MLEKIGRIDIFDGVKVADFAQALGQGKIQYIKQEVIDRYLDAVESQSIRKGICADSGMKVVYTPLNGARKYVRAGDSRPPSVSGMWSR